MSAPTVTLEVTDRFNGLRRQYLWSRTIIASAVALSLCLTAWLLLAFVDYLWEWPLTWRLTGLASATVSVGAWYLSRLVAIVKETREKPFAGLLESSFDGFGQRIRTVLDTVKGRVSGPQEMLTALGHQTLGRWETLSPQQLIPARGLLTASGLLLAIALLAGGLFFQGGDWQIAMQRALGNELPYTTWSVEPGDTRVLEGQPVNLSLVLAGRTNRDVLLKYRFVEPEYQPSDSSGTYDTDAEPEWTESELLPTEPGEGTVEDPRRAVFEASLGKATLPVEYQFVTGVGSTGFYRIDVQPLIEVQHTETLVRPPAYTRLEQRSFSLRDLTVLENSEVNVTVKTTHPLREAVLETGAKSSRLVERETKTGEDRTLWTFTLPSTASLFWKFSGNGSDGTPLTPIKGRLRIRRDNAPRISWREPTNEIRVHTLAEVPLAVQISDDYGLSESGIIFQLGVEEDFLLKDWKQNDQATTNTTRLKLEEILPLESFGLTEKDFISYYAYAIDNREGRPQRSESEIRYIDIRPLRQYFSESEAQPGNGGSRSLRVGLDELISRQRFLINRTRRLTRATNASLASQLGTIDRLVENQSELAGLVRALTEFLISRGNDDVEALNQAEAAMLQASDSLAAGSFDLALAQQNEALLALVEARDLVELSLIKNPTPQQQRELARFSRNFLQKLRRERPKTEREIADDLQQIARQQMQVCSMCQNAGSAMSSSSASASANTPEATENPADEPTSEQTEPATPGDTPEETPDADRENTASNDDGTNDGEEQETEGPSREEQEEEIFARQIELLERLEAIEERISERLSESDLMSRRMESAMQGMNELVDRARDRRFEGYPRQGRDVADRLRELGAQLETLQEVEAVSRLSSLRDMTIELANMENELSGQLREPPPSSPSGEDSGSTERTARRISARTETIEEALQIPAEAGDVESSEVNDELRKFVEERRFLEHLRRSREAAEKTARNERPETSPAAGDRAFERAVEFAEDAQRLDELYQELLAPRLVTLRFLENKINQLIWKSSQGQSGSSERSELEPELEAQAAALQEKLKDAGLSELAELLDSSEVTDEQIDQMYEKLSRRTSGGVAADGFHMRGQQSVQTKRAIVLIEKLRKEIREMILEEISADRDAPIPVEFQRLVDGYFRTIAGEEETINFGSDE
jgi:hypothetical protein